MTKIEAQANIGQPFKVTAIRRGLLSQFDTIVSVSSDGFISGNFITAHCDDCRLKQETPVHFMTIRPEFYDAEMPDIRTLNDESPKF